MGLYSAHRGEGKKGKGKGIGKGIGKMSRVQSVSVAGCVVSGGGCNPKRPTRGGGEKGKKTGNKDRGSGIRDQGSGIG